MPARALWPNRKYKQCDIWLVNCNGMTASDWMLTKKNMESWLVNDDVGCRRKMNENILYAPTKNPALSGYKIKFLYIFIWVNMLRHRFAAAFGDSFAHGSAIRRRKPRKFLYIIRQIRRIFMRNSVWKCHLPSKNFQSFLFCTLKWIYTRAIMPKIILD